MIASIQTVTKYVLQKFVSITKRLANNILTSVSASIAATYEPNYGNLLLSEFINK